MARTTGRPRWPRRNGREGVHDWLVETAPDVPRSDLPKPFLGGRVRLRWVRVAVGASVLLVPVLAIALMVTLVGSAPAAGPGAASPSPSQAVATAAVLQWMRRDPSPLPGGGQLLTWDGATTLPEPRVQPGSADVPVEMDDHTFTVLAATGRLYKVSVVTATTPAAGTFTVGDPSLIPVAPPEPGTSVRLWQTLSLASPTANVLSAVNAWAAAYTSGDPGALLQATGDPDTTHSYMPLAGVRFTRIDATQAAAVRGDGPERGGDETPAAMVVRVDVDLYWLAKGQETVPADPSDNEVSPASFDLLVERADTAAPVVVAWGAAGSGELLRPYQNAIAGRALVAETPAPSTGPAPTTTPSVTGPSATGPSAVAGSPAARSGPGPDGAR